MFINKDEFLAVFCSMSFFCCSRYIEHLWYLFLSLYPPPRFLFLHPKPVSGSFFVRRALQPRAIQTIILEGRERTLAEEGREKRKKRKI